ncbi:NifB/NifX family molybdenum-iron cluster-binding protein [Thermodesulforhabdus norvegica]|uniref:Dinitrogenase iron-molybdenum cofactor n=1 Tax=Thermodesulforhabdus norvegica TaxID=39841 RepID=A0A1I4SGH1_9BACT|nr:NifB/NifX family molybdenum-iron cluster-binding protein [Thermodesulforhabdus norvegica]SFM63588.1 Dinitrogenase iron-molybdenum cofactor [Thermodesulforhabdus norvegica]
MEAKGRERKILVALRGEEVASRFDMAPEAWLAVYREGEGFSEEKTVVLPQASAENLCRLIVSEGVDTVVCGGIEQEYYEYLTWKKISVVDFVVGTLDEVKRKITSGDLKPGDILIKGTGE